MPLFALLFVIAGVFAIDIGMLLMERRAAQNAVDLASLAASQELPRSELENNVEAKLVTARDVASEFLALNGYAPSDPDVTATISTRHQGDIRKLEIVVEREHDFIFAGYFGISDSIVTARAVAETNAIPRDVLLLLDRSGSMCQESHTLVLECPNPSTIPWQPFDQVRTASDTFATLFQQEVEGVPFDRIGLVPYSYSASLTAPLSIDYGPGSALETAVWAMVPAGYTNFGHAIATAREHLEANVQPRREQVIVLLSDGFANRYPNAAGAFLTCEYGCSQADDYALEQAELAADAGISIFTIGLRNASGEPLLQTIAEIGRTRGHGGGFFGVDDVDDLETTFIQIANQISYTLVE